MVDGLANSVVESDVVALPNAPTGSAANYSGNAFIVQDKTLRTEGEGGRDYEWSTDRRWQIVNKARTHYSSGKGASYQLMVKVGFVVSRPLSLSLMHC
jgi:primary-amine oxidase